MTTMSIPIIAGQRPRAFDRLLIALGTTLTGWGKRRAEMTRRPARVEHDLYRDAQPADLIHYRLR